MILASGVDKDESCNEDFGGHSGLSYRGCQTKTVSGKTCQKWTVQTPHRHSRKPANYPNAGLGDHNYCRNPDREPAIWCYTTDPQKRWEFCNPLPETGTGQYCVKVTTHTTPGWSKGDVDIKIDIGSG